MQHLPGVGADLAGDGALQAPDGTILARHIIEMAQGGERDPKSLADSALLYIAQRKLTRKPPEDI